MNRVALLTAVSILTLPFSSIAAKRPKDIDAKKSVIFIIVDDMRLDMTNYGGGDLETPNLNMLKSESVNFANACTTTGLSSPSRAALYSGRMGHRTGLEDNLNLWHCENLTLSAEQSTLYEWANDKGYNIAHFGKWHVGHITPAMRGADQYIGSANEQVIKKMKRPDFTALDRYYPDENGKVEEVEEKPEYYVTLDIPYEKTEAKKQVDLGVQFLREWDQNDDRPLFLTLSFHTPHPSYKVPAPWNKMYDYRDIQLPESINEDKDDLEFQHDILWPWMNVGHMSDDDWRKTISYSKGLCTMFDQALGEFFEELKANGLWDNSLIVFTSDQGSMLAEHGLYDKGPYAYDGLMRIPMLVKMPGVKPADIQHQVSLIDLNQTLVEYMGLQPRDANLDSRSLIPLIKYGDEAWADIPDVAYYTYERYNGRWFGVRAIRTPEFKYVFNPLGSDELYDLEGDPHEMVNLVDSDKHQSILLNLRIQLLQHLQKIDDTKAYEMMSGYTKVAL